MKLNLKAAALETKVDKSRHRIMLVDDEPGNLRTLTRFLSDVYPLACFEKPEEALALLAKGGPEAEFALIISDHIMPRMTGVEFFSELAKKNHPSVRIMLTGFAALDNVIAAINDAGVFRYVTKPVDSSTINQAVKEAINFYELREENGKLIRLVKELIETGAQMSKELSALGHGDKVPSLSAEGVAATSPRRMPVAVLFADVRGFTKLSGEQPPELIMDTLQRLFKPMHEVIYASGGIVDKHLGDGLMAVFGLGGAASYSASTNACMALCDIVESTIGSLTPPFNELKVSLGLAAGEVVVGLLGSESRSELAVIGQPANFAARLQEFSKLALTEAGRELFGEFNRVMAVVDHRLAEGKPGMKLLELPDDIRVRDFANETSVGVVSR